MATAVVFVCAGVDGQTIDNGRTTSGLSADLRQVPHCPSGGTWTVIEYVDPSTLDTTLDLNQLSMAFGSGFSVVGVGLLLAFAVRVVVRSVRDA